MVEQKKKKKGRARKRTAPPKAEIIIKFREGGALEEREGRLHAEHLSLDRFYQTLESVKAAQVRRSFAVERSRLREMQDRAARNLKRPLASLDLFVRVRVTEDVDVDALVKQFAEDPEVEYACRAGVPAPPPSPDYTGLQDYEDAAPDGVNARYAWFFPGGDGAAVQVCDCEYGFNPGHEDLPGVTVASNRDGDLSQWEDHGTGVLGVLAGEADVQGVTGICHGATLLFASESGLHRLDCITDAITGLNAGDVLVLEMQSGNGAYKPAEYDPDVHVAVSTAVGLGICVVAAAGNGGIDLTTSVNALGNLIWDPASPEYDDSGGVIVGAGGSTSNAHPHSRLSFSDYGVRVNCQGWGEDVVTTGGGDLHDGGTNATYTDTFGGTSSATPIVAGIVVCLQGAAIEALGGPLAPLDVRALLSDPANGTPQADSPTYAAATYPIGPLPDLARVIRAAGIYPDVYMRDNVADTGTEPYIGGTLCWSPDIIARKSPVADPAAAFGVATWDAGDLGEQIEFGQENHVYVRMHNRGNAPDDVTVSVYWGDASAFLHPSTWNLLGTLNVSNVLPGEYRVAGPVSWPAADVPAVGHYCLIAVVNSERDPITIPGAFSTVSDYLDFVRNHNNICYRNTDVEDVLPNAPAPPYTFLVRGLPEKAARFRLEVRHGLPKGAAVEVEVAKRLHTVERLQVVEDQPRGVRRLASDTRLLLKGRRPLIVDEILLGKGHAVAVQIRVQLPKRVAPGNYLIHADQYLGKAHLGRVNYMLRVGRRRAK